jgi:hypothetical protein
LVDAIVGYELGDPGVTLSGFAELREHLLQGGPCPDRTVIDEWLERQSSLAEEANSILAGPVTEGMINLVLTGKSPEWVESDWLAHLRNPWSEDLAGAIYEARTTLGM